MPVPGRKPKHPDQRRNKMPPTHEWVEVANVAFGDGPALPRWPARRRPDGVPEPGRPLGTAGASIWHRAWNDSYVAPDAELLLQLCEQADERVALRVRVLKDGDWHERQALRNLDAQVAAGLRALRLDGPNSHPSAWPVATRRWWKALSSMPHCVLWADVEWQFATDSALLVAAFHNGDLRLGSEIRTREKLMGTSPDARRDLRIRYVDPDSGTEADPSATASVTAMDSYRKMAGA